MVFSFKQFLPGGLVNSPKAFLLFQQNSILHFPWFAYINFLFFFFWYVGFLVISEQIFSFEPTITKVLILLFNQKIWNFARKTVVINHLNVRAKNRIYMKMGSLNFVPILEKTLKIEDFNFGAKR